MLKELNRFRWVGYALLLLMPIWIVWKCRSEIRRAPPVPAPTPRVITPVPLTPSEQADRVMLDSLNALHP